ncbi:MAG: acyltransferase [Saprospiraceae bacterium]|nr:acyltransferase [Saprospiraceae bacterium]
MNTRLHFLDNLRTFSIFLVVLLHSGLVYEQALESQWIVIDEDKNDSIGLIRMYLDVFVMFTLFFVSGYFIIPSIKRKSARDFIIGKFKRIMVPWLVAVLTLIPAYKFIFLFSRGLPQEEWYSYFHIFQREGGNPWNYADNPLQNWLWFLPILFVFQLIYIAGSRINFKIKPPSLLLGALLLLVVGVVFSMIVSNAGLSGWHHSAVFHFQRERLLIYFMTFLLGALCYEKKVFDTTAKNTKAIIWANVILTLSITIFTATALNLFFNLIDPNREYYFVSNSIDRIAYYSTMIITMLSILYLLLASFKSRLNWTNSLLEELNKNSYYVYIIHMIVLGLVAVPLLSVSIPAFLKFLVLTILTFIISNLFVSAYKRNVEKYLSKNWIYIGVICVALIVVFYVYQH